jgi:hypothetical protein
MMAAHPARRRIQGIESAEFSPETRFQAARSASSYTAWRRMPLGEVMFPTNERA